MKFIKLILAVFLSATACLTQAAKTGKSAEQEDIVLVFEKKTPSKRKSKTKPSALLTSPPCAFHLAPTQDNRQNKLTVGTTLTKPLDAKGVDIWANEVFKHQVQPYLSASGNSIEIRPSLTRLYSYTQNMNIHGIIALRIDYALNDEIIFTERYRGLGSKANMMNGVGEYLKTLNRASYDAAEKVVRSLPDICKKIETQ